MHTTILHEPPTTAQTITPALSLMASTLVKLAHPTNTALHRALDKAQPRMASHPWCYDAAVGTIAITSASQPNVVRYASADGCDCRSGGCWHRAAALICSTLCGTGMLPVAALPLVDPAYVLEHANDDDDGYEWVDEAEDTAAWSDGRHGECQACGKPFVLRSLNPLCARCDVQPEPAPPPVFRPVDMPKRVTIKRPANVALAVGELF